MSHVRGPGRGGKPNGYFAEQHVGHMPDQQGQQKFVTPYVPTMPGYRGPLPQMQMNPPQMGYQNQYGQYNQAPQQQYYQQHNMPAQQPQQQQQQQPPQQQYTNYRPDYQQQQSNMYMYQQPMYQETVNYPPPHQQQQVHVAPAEPRKRNILEIVDPSTQKAIKVTSSSSSSAAPAQPPARVVAPEFAEKKQQLSREFMVAVKKEISEDQKPKTTTTVSDSAPAPVISQGVPIATGPMGIPTNFNYPPPSIGQAPPGIVPSFVPAVVPNVAFVPSAVEATAPVAVQNPVQSEVAAKSAEPTTPPVALDLQVKTSPPEVATTGVSEAVSVTPAMTPALSKVDSKEETEDDKFDETTSQFDETTTPEPGSGETEKSPEELAAEKAQKEAEAAERKKAQEELLSSQIADLLSKGVGDVTNGTYARDFMVAVRDYEKAFNRTPCPLSPEKLSDFGLDIKSMRVQDKKRTFTPDWVPNNKLNRQPHSYRGRTTTDGTGRGGQTRDRQNHKRPPVVRASIERVQRVTLPSSKNAWKPDRQKTSEDVSEEEKSIELVCKNVRSLMNKITPTSQIPLTKEFINFNVSSNDSQLGQVVGIVFDKAVEEPKFCALYAELCKAQVDHELNINQNKSAFRNKILTRTQQNFQDKKDYDEERWLVIAKEEDPEKRKLLEIEEKQKFRRRKFGVMTFIGFLYRNHLLSTKIVYVCVCELFASILPKKEGKDKDEKELPLRSEDIDEESVHCALQLVETVGAMLDKSKEGSPAFLDQWFQKLEAAKSFCSNKIRFMIMNLVEMRNNKWVPRKSVESGPKKIEEIHNDIRQEKIDNEKARDQYDRDRDRRGGVRPNSNSLRKNPPVSRNSLERGKNYQPDQKRALAAATTKLTSSSVQPKNISLSATMNDSNLGGKSKKEWHSGASGGGNTASEAPKNAWGRRDSDQRKKSTIDDKQAALALAKDVGNMSLSARRSASQNSVADQVEEELTDEQKKIREKLMNTVSSDIREVVDGLLPIKEMVDALKEYVGKEKYASPSLTGVFEMAFRSITERTMKPDERRTLGHVFRLSLVGKAEKKALIDGAVNFCKFAVETEMPSDFPNIWTVTADVLVNTSHVHHDILKEEKVEHFALCEMEPIFKAAKMEYGNKKHELFVQVIKGLVQFELDENNSAEGFAWEYAELKFKKEMEKDGMKSELEKVVMDNKQTLAELLNI